MTTTLNVYLPQDRRRALAMGQPLPDRTSGAALFADISGFTPLTEALACILGPRRGAEALTRELDAVYNALIAAVERFGGSVISFAGDAITCWFDDRDGAAAQRAVACARTMQQAMEYFAAVPMPDGTTTGLALKAAVATGPVRRFVVGDPTIQCIDALAGTTITRTATAEHLACAGEVLVDACTAETLGASLHLDAWREDPATHERFGVVAAFTVSSTMIVPVPADDSATPERWQAWVLPAVYARERAGHGTFLTEFRPTVALFLRFVGIDYEHGAAGIQLDMFIRQAQDILARYEAVLLQLTIGDKGSYLYAAFGAPTAHEDDVRRALKAALDLKKAAEQLDFLEPVQIGLSCGTMRTGAYGGTTRRTYGVLGDDVNLAARLMMHAAPGEILVSGRVQMATATAFDLAAYPAMRIKGKTGLLPVFAVIGAQQRRAIRLQEPSYALPMVGRQAELQTTMSKMDVALQGQGQVVGIVAEAGLGKSRLVAEVIRAARRAGFVGYGGACQSDGINTPYLVWRPIWSAFFDVDPALPLSNQVRALEGAIAERAPHRMAAMPLLSAVLGLPLPDNDFTQALDPQTRKSALHALLEDCLKAAARETPLLLVFEDLHWIDALSHDLLDELARAIVALPVFIVLAYRPPELQRLQTPRLEALPYFTKVTLTELLPADCVQIIGAKLAQRYPAHSGNMAPLMVEMLTARAQGNPFYLEELLNYLHDRGINAFDPAALDNIALPDSLHALILSRIDQLTDREQTTLRVASIIGRLFRAAWLPGYYPALGDPVQVHADLDELHRLDITPLDTPEPDLAYLFKHIVTHEVTYESLPYATRARLHEQLARYLETTYSDTPLLDTLAYHYGQSANTTKQCEYFQKAGDAAKAAFANEAALAYYERLLPLLSDAGARADLHLQWGAVLELVGRWDEAERHYRAALAQADGNPDGTARSQLALGKLARLRGDNPAALAWLAQARSGWEAFGNRAGLAQAHIETGHVFMRQSAYTAAGHHLQAGLALAREVNDTLRMALALNSLGVVAYFQADYGAARMHYAESLALRRTLGDKPGMASTLNNLGLVVAEQGDYAAAQAPYQEGLALWHALGDKRGMATTLHNLGIVAAEQDDYGTAWTLYAESLALRRALGDKPGIASTLDHLGLVVAEQGDHAAARALFEESLELSREMGDKHRIASSVSRLGIMALHQGVYAAARAQFEEGLELNREIGGRKGVAETLVGLAGLSCQEGDYVRGARLAAAAETLRNAIQYVLAPLERRLYTETVEAAHAALGEAAFDAAWAAGQALTLEEAIAFALTPASGVTSD